MILELDKRERKEDDDIKSKAMRFDKAFGHLSNFAKLYRLSRK